MPGAVAPGANRNAFFGKRFAHLIRAETGRNRQISVLMYNRNKVALDDGGYVKWRRFMGAATGSNAA